MTHSVIIGPLPVPGSAGDSHSSRPPIDASPALHLGSRETKGGFRAGRAERQAAPRPASIGHDRVGHTGQKLQVLLILMLEALLGRR
ncbi:MAG: hypothetical protein ACFNS9_00005 [Actinomyces sp.]